VSQITRSRFGSGIRGKTKGDGTFTHPSSFPLTNSHAGHQCSVCHTTPGTFAGLSNQCITCHQSDFQRGHNGQGSTNCAQCHNTRNWD